MPKDDPIVIVVDAPKGDAGERPGAVPNRDGVLVYPYEEGYLEALAWYRSQTSSPSPGYTPPPLTEADRALAAYHGITDLPERIKTANGYKYLTAGGYVSAALEGDSAADSEAESEIFGIPTSYVLIGGAAAAILALMVFSKK